MSDQDEEVEKPFAIERAKTCRAKCKKCKCPIDKDSVRIAKLMSNPFGDGKMKAWHHVTCIFDVFAKQRATTKRIEDPSEDVSGWDDLDDDDKAIVLEKLEEFENNAPYKNGTKKTIPTKKNVTPSPSPGKKNVTPSPSPGKKNLTPSPSPGKKNVTPSPSPAKDNSVNSTKRKLDNSASTSKQQKKMKKDAKAVASIIRDDAFCEFRGLCNELAHVSAYSAKTAIVKRMLTKGTEGDGFKSDVYLWCKLLLPGAVKRIYNLQSKQLVKLFARLFRQNENEMLEDLDKGDVAQTIKRFFEKSVIYKPNVKSLLTIQEVDAFLEELCQLTKEDDQENHFGTIIGRCTSDDLLMIIRLIKRDLRINAGPKHILEAVHSDAYQAYQVSNDLTAVIERCLGLNTSTKTSTSPTKILGDSKVALSLMTPVLPMLAEACKSVEMAMKKCPNGMLSEVKYDGERVQVHKHGAEFRYFSRSLKPVLPHKIKLFKDYIPKAFPDGDDLILDSEILMIDTTTGQPLPFGTLGKHKKQEFQDANVCLFVFDCLYYNGDVLLNKPMKERRSILEDRMTVIPNRIMLSEVQEVHDPKDLAQMIAKVLKMGLEGLVLKDMKSLYEPGKRHWLKVKKDYLLGGAMADSADLVVLGAWYGTGQKGGMMSVFLMGCYDSDTDLWYTVTKVHTGHDDATLARLQGELKMIKIGKDPKLVPDWLNVNRPMVPDFIAADPKKQPVWEITGAEFTNQGVHTADSISIRFPRVTRIRKDKNYRTATSLSELRDLFEASAESIDYLTLLGTDDGDKKKPTKLDAYLKPGPSGFSKSPSTSPSKKIKDERISDDESIGSESDSEDSIQPNGNANTRIVSKATKGKNNAIFDGIRITFSDDLDKAKRQYLRTILQTNGAKVLTGRRISETTHVVHGTCELPATVLHDYPEVPKKARHVNYSWIEESLAESRVLDVLPHAVKLLGVYCNCPCPH